MIAALIVERKKFFWIDCRGASISDGFGCRVRRGSSGATFSFERGAAAITLDIHLEDGGVMDETIDRGERHGGVRKYLVPFAKWLIGGDEQRASFVAGADELEQHAGLGLVLGDIGEIIEDEEIEAVEPIDGGLEIELAAGDLELLNEVGSAGEEHPPSILDQGETERCPEMALSAAGRAEQEQVGAFAQPAVAGSERGDLRL